MPTDIYMTHTNERIHQCVRVRLELEGLDLDDRGIYKCTALLRKDKWRLRQMRIKVDDPIPWNASWGPGAPGPVVSMSLWRYYVRRPNVECRVINQMIFAGYGSIMAPRKTPLVSGSWSRNPLARTREN